MRINALWMVAAPLLLVACGGVAEEEDGVLSETELGDVDVIEGTISDAMIQPDALDAPVVEEDAAGGDAEPSESADE